MGPQNHAGSALKNNPKSMTQRSVNALRFEYEAITNIPLHVRCVGDMGANNMATVIAALVRKTWYPSRPAIGLSLLPNTCNGLRVHVTKAFRSDWYSVNNRVGFVNRDPRKMIADAIEKKSKALTRSQALAGPDIRLLLVADRFHNSGKLMLEERTAFDFDGFQLCISSLP